MLICALAQVNGGVAGQGAALRDWLALREPSRPGKGIGKRGARRSRDRWKERCFAPRAERMPIDQRASASRSVRAKWCERERVERVHPEASRKARQERTRSSKPQGRAPGRGTLRLLRSPKFPFEPAESQMVRMRSTTTFARECIKWRANATRKFRAQRVGSHGRGIRDVRRHL